MKDKKFSFTIERYYTITLYPLRKYLIYIFVIYMDNMKFSIHLGNEFSVCSSITSRIVLLKQ